MAKPKTWPEDIVAQLIGFTAIRQAEIAAEWEQQQASIPAYVAAEMPKIVTEFIARATEVAKIDGGNTAMIRRDDECGCREAMEAAAVELVRLGFWDVGVMPCMGTHWILKASWGTPA